MSTQQSKHWENSQWIEHALLKMRGWIRFPVGIAKDLKDNTCGPPTIVLGVFG